jgi:hypothetical protein
MADFKNYVDLGAKTAPTLFQGPNGERMLGFLMLLCDTVAEGASYALRAPWLLRSDFPPDAAAPLGKESNLDAYATETNAQHVTRLRRRWDDWPYAGDETALVGQLAAAGYVGAVVQFYPSSPGPHGEGEYWSQFWIYFPPGTHPVTAAGPSWGSFNWGDGTLYGPVGLTQPYVETLIGIIQKWKPGHWICRGIIFGLTGAAIWGEFDWGDGTNYGGAVELGLGGPELFPGG